MSFWNDVPFSERVVLFGIEHILYLVSVILITAVFVWKLEAIKKNLRIVRKVLIVISIIQLIGLYSWSIFELGFSLEAGLPIHLCRISSFVGLYFLFTEDKRVMTLLYYMSAFALIAVLYPVNVHPIYTHIIGWSYQISHLLIVLVWILIVYVYKYQPTQKTANWAWLYFFIFVLLIWPFNYLVGDGEYLYLRGDVNRPFLKDVHDIIWISVMMIICYGVMFFMTLPYKGKNAPTN